MNDNTIDWQAECSDLALTLHMILSTRLTDSDFEHIISTSTSMRQVAERTQWQLLERMEDYYQEVLDRRS